MPVPVCVPETGVEAEERDVSSVSGDVRMDDVACEEGEFDSVSGNIRYTGRITNGGRYEFKSHSGDVGFELEANTFRGDIESMKRMTFFTRASSSALVGDSAKQKNQKHHRTQFHISSLTTSVPAR